MAFPTTVAPVVTNPGGTGNTITPTLPSGHAAGDVIEIWIGNSGVTTWSAPAGWIIKQQIASGGNASTGVVGTLLRRLVLPGDTLPLTSPTCTLNATVTRGAIAFVKRGADIDGVHTAPEWLAFSGTTGSANPIRPTSVTTRSPENLVTHYYVQRAATNAPEPSNYTQVQEIVISGTIVINVSERNVAAQATVLNNQDASPTSGVRWVGMMSCTPTPDYPYYRASASATVASGTSVTPALPTGTTASDVNGRKDFVIATVEAAGNAIAIAPNTPGDWTEITGFSDNTSGNGTTARKYWALYDGSLDRAFTRPTNGELSAYLNTYHNVHQTVPIGAVNKRQNASSTTSTWNALTRTTAKVTMNSTCVADAVPNFTSPTGWIERMDGLGMTCCDQSFDATGSTASASFTLSTASPTLVGLIEIIAATASVPITVTPGTLALTTTEFAPSLKLAITPGTLSLTSSTFAPTVITGTTVTPSTASLSISTFALTLSEKVTPSTLVLTLTWFAPKLSETLTPNFAALTLTAFAPSLDSSVTVTPNATSLTLATFAPQLTLATTPSTVSLTTSTFASVLRTSVTPTTGTLSTAAFAPALKTAVIPSTQTLTLTTFAPSIGGQITITPSTASLVLSQFAPTIVTPQTVTPTTQALTLSTFAPSAVVGSAVTPTTVNLTLNTFAPRLAISIIPTTANLTLTEFIPQLLAVLNLASPTTLTLTTFAPNVSAAPSFVVTFPVSLTINSMNTGSTISLMGTGSTLNSMDTGTTLQ